MWSYQGKKIETLKDFGSDIIGFVYKITDTKKNKIYIGKKSLFSNRKVKLGKKEKLSLPKKPGRTPTFKRVIGEMDWQNYYGSSKVLLEEINSREKLEFKREILILCRSKKQLSYWEMYYQCIHNVLLEDTYNDNISGKYHRKDLI